MRGACRRASGQAPEVEQRARHLDPEGSPQAEVARQVAGDQVGAPVALVPVEVAHLSTLPESGLVRPEKIGRHRPAVVNGVDQDPLAGQLVAGVARRSAVERPRLRDGRRDPFERRDGRAVGRARGRASSALLHHPGCHRFRL